MAQPRTPRTPKQQVGVPAARNPGPIIAVVAVAVALIFAVAVLITAPWESDEESGVTGAVETQAVSVEGAPLAQQPADGQPDPVIGSAAPELTGSTFTGEPVEITNDGRPKAVLFFTHWCPVCQRELPVITTWLDDNRQNYPGVDFYSISTDNRPTQGNYPPSEWFDDENYPLPVLADSSRSDASNAYGLSGYPYMVFLNSDHEVVSRVSAEVPADQFTNYIEAINSAE